MWEDTSEISENASENTGNTSENAENIRRNQKCPEGRGVTLRSDEECGRPWDWCCYMPRDAPCSSMFKLFLSTAELVIRGKGIIHLSMFEEHIMVTRGVIGSSAGITCCPGHVLVS